MKYISVFFIGKCTVCKLIFSNIKNRILLLRNIFNNNKLKYNNKKFKTFVKTCLLHRLAVLA